MNHPLTRQDVGHVDLSFIHKQLQDANVSVRGKKGTREQRSRFTPESSDLGSKPGDGIIDHGRSDLSVSGEEAELESEPEQRLFVPSGLQVAPQQTL